MAAKPACVAAIFLAFVGSPWFPLIAAAGTAINMFTLVFTALDMPLQTGHAERRSSILSKHALADKCRAD
jgi:hypothetical protein